MHIFPRKIACSLVFLFLLFPTLAKAVPPDVVLVSPLPNEVFNSSNDITFTCNATDDGQMLNLTLFHNLNGSFSANQTERYGEVYFDYNTNFLCNFNGNLECQASGNGSPLANESLDFQDGKFSQGIWINETGILRYQTSGNFDRNQGTIEFWIRSESDVNNYRGYIFDAADIDAEGQNEMMIYFYYGELRFWIWDGSGNEYYAVQDASSFQAGTWYHIAAVWDLDSNVTGDGDRMAVYVSGSMEESDYSGGSTISYSFTSSSLSIGSDKYTSAFINATIDDFRISSTVRSPSEINQSYYNGLEDYSSVSKSWAFSSVPDGSYIWNCMAYDNDSESNQSSQINFYVDVSTPPAVNSISLNPYSAGDVDPGITINATANVTDPSGVSAVIFQWKKVGEWNNITMDYNTSSGLYGSASFQTGMVSGVYFYRTWSNDTNGNLDYSQTQNFTSAWDFTWTRSPVSFGTVYGLIDSKSNVGMLEINNTGDDTLNFSLLHNWPRTVYYNDSEETNFYVAGHATMTINITADFASTSSENDMLITINASHPTETASPLSLTTNATINSYSGGPYLSVSITDYTAMVSQSQTFNLSAKVKNIGNETAEGTWLNWTLPEGWESASGNITQFIGSLSSGSFFLSNLTITVSPSAASPGTLIIYANSSCSQNISGYDSKTVGVSCSNSDGVCGYGCSYVTDTDCGIPSAPGGGGTTDILVGGGGSATTVQYALSMDFEKRMDIERGQNKSLRIRISNGEKATNLSSIYIYISGYPLTHARISPAYISVLEYNTSGFFDIELFAPNYMKYGIYNITLTVRATGNTITSRNTTEVEKSKALVLVIRSVKENETAETVESGRSAIEEMAGLGLGTAGARGLLEKALAQIYEWDYDNALETLKSLMETRDRSVSIYSAIKQVEVDVTEAESYGILTPESKKMSSLSKSALQREDYAKAEERISNALVAYVIESRGIEIMKFLHTYWWLVVGLSASLASGFYAFHRRRFRTTLKRRLEKLSEEEAVIKSIMEKARTQYYKERLVPAVEFHGMMAQNESRLAEIKRKKSRLLEMSGLLGKGAGSSESYLRKEIMEAQKKYFEERTITKSSYSRTIQGLREELADAIRNIESMEGRRKGQCGFLIMLLFCMLLIPAILAQADERQSALDSMTKAEGWISEMSQMGFPTNRANDTLSEARLLFSRGFYKGAESLANDVQSIKARTIQLDGLADQTEEKIFELESQGIDASQAKVLFVQGLDALSREDYDGSEYLFSQVQSKSEELQVEASIRRVSQSGSPEWLLAQARENWHIILVACLAAGAAGMEAGRIKRKKKRQRMMAGLEKEKASLEKAAAETQKKYFERGNMSKADYEIFSSSYRKKLADVKRRKAVLEGAVSRGKQGK